MVCGACRTELRSIRATHKGVTDDEFKALQKRCEETLTPMKRSHVRALHKSNAQRESESEWPMLSVRIPRGIMQSLDELAADSGRSKAEVVRSLLGVVTDDGADGPAKGQARGKYLNHPPDAASRLRTLRM